MNPLTSPGYTSYRSPRRSATGTPSHLASAALTPNSESAMLRSRFDSKWTACCLTVSLTCRSRRHCRRMPDRPERWHFETPSLARMLDATDPEGDHISSHISVSVRSNLAVEEVHRSKDKASPFG